MSESEGSTGRAGPTFVAVEMHDRSARAGGTPTAHNRARHPHPTIQGPQGIYARWTWDGETLSVETDRYGIYPLFHCRTARGVMVSPSVTELLRQGAPRDIDWTAVSVFLRWGNFLAEDTAFEAIRAFPPGGRALWKQGRWTVEGGIEHATPNRLGREAALEGFIELFAESMRRRLTGDRFTAVPLSGGRDSRHILLEMHRLGYRPDVCLTALPQGSHIASETPTAGELAGAVGARHVTVPPPADRLAAESRKNRATGFASMQHGWYWAVIDALSEIRPPGETPVVFDGLAGDVLSAGLFATPDAVADLEAGRLETLARRLLQEGEDAPAAPRSPRFRAETRGKLSLGPAVDRLVDELKRHEGAPNPLQSFLLYNRTRRGVGAPFLNMWGTASELRFPFLDHELFDHLMGLPARITLDHQFHTDAIRRAYPRFAGIPYTQKDVGTRHSPTEYRERAWALMRRVRGGTAIPWIRSAWATPRLLACMVSSRYSRNVNWIEPFLAYFDDLARAVEEIG